MNLLGTPHGRKLLFSLLYLSEGIPIGFLWWALPTLLRDAGVEVARIGAFASVLVLPWALKFIWAPLVDGARGTKFGLKGCIVLAQATMAVTFLPLAFIDPRSGFTVLAPCLMAHAVAAATQDAAIDALAISSTAPGERGSLNGWMQAGMLAGRGSLGGGALLLAGRWGMPAVVLLICTILAGLLLLAFVYRTEEGERGNRSGGGLRGFTALLRAAASRRATWLGLLFAAVAGAGFEAAGILAGPFLVDRGLGTAAVGWFYTMPSVVAMIAGALAGGALADRVRRPLAVALSQVAVSAAILSLAAMAMTADTSLSRAACWTVLTAIYFGIGLFTASSYALFMDLTDPRLGATQFSAYMGATNLCESWAAALGGRLASGAGYAPAFAITTMLSLLALPLLLYARNTDRSGV